MSATEQEEMCECIAMLEEAAAHNHMLACGNLGIIFDIGIGVTKDKTRAFQFYLRAAKQGDASAEYNVGTMVSCEEGWEGFQGQHAPPTCPLTSTGTARARARCRSLKRSSGTRRPPIPDQTTTGL